ncbi:hypothetical protein T4E_11521 [Trichinella pseudospiralis]|uniref:Uncharacterized protein n=1 Tax=Trichinella pseudospiralis TaxID=6337 RepID=A0A0V0XZ37_TRIPS|nr:hypothetical protein T4E_11521 [Trichinella pseudospiralis]
MTKALLVAVCSYRSILILSLFPKQTPESSLIKAEQEFVSRTPLNSTLASLLTKLQQWALPTNEKPQKWETLEVMNYQRNIVK